MATTNIMQLQKKPTRSKKKFEPAEGIDLIAVCDSTKIRVKQESHPPGVHSGTRCELFL